MAGYSNTPLLKKLGLKDKSINIFINLPPELKNNFKSVNPIFTFSADADYIHLFETDQKDLFEDFKKAKDFVKKSGSIWISWPKGGKFGTDLNENIVRRIGLDFGLVDVKVAAIDNIWSGLKFVYRLKDR